MEPAPKRAKVERYSSSLVLSLCDFFPRVLAQIIWEYRRGCDQWENEQAMPADEFQPSHLALSKTQVAYAHGRTVTGFKLSSSEEVFHFLDDNPVANLGFHGSTLCVARVGSFRAYDLKTKDSHPLIRHLDCVRYTETTDWEMADAFVSGTKWAFMVNFDMVYYIDWSTAELKKQILIDPPLPGATSALLWLDETRLLICGNHFYGQCVIEFDLDTCLERRRREISDFTPYSAFTVFHSDLFFASSKGLKSVSMEDKEDVRFISIPDHSKAAEGMTLLAMTMNQEQRLCALYAPIQGAFLLVQFV